jgi:UDP-N-acetylglucosamine 2-epimerase (non-hydrolysing)
MNRVLTSRLAAIHFAATNWAAENLRREGIDSKTIAVTGNPGIDAIQFVAGRLAAGQLSAPAWPWLKPDRRMILVTAHRRESFGAGFERICAALATLSEREDVQVVYPVHPNPNVAGVVRDRLQAHGRITLIEPQPYVPFVDLMRRAELILTDSGGVQEEAPALGKPVLVLRDNTERPEGVEAGTVRLVGTDPERIVREAARLLDDPSEAAAMSLVHNPYGDGQSGPRIAKLIDSFLAGN